MRTIFFVSLFIFLSSCKKDGANVNQYENIPDVAVNLFLQLDQPAYFELSAVGGYVYVEGGSRGILVYRTIDDYKAYERHSPNRSDESCAVISVDSTMIYAVEECDGIQYYLVDGTVARGNTSVPLLQYQTQESQGSLHIFN